MSNRDLFRRAAAPALVALGASAVFAFGVSAELSKHEKRVDPAPVGVTGGLAHGDWCALPAPREAEEKGAALRVLAIGEAEPNSSVGDAQALPLSLSESEIDVSGSISPAGDLDFFSVDLNAGDVLSASVLGASGYDTQVAVLDAGGALIVENDDDSFSGIYPASSPLLHTSGLNPNLSFIAPATGTYIVRVRPFSAASTGSYTLRLRLFRPALESLPAGERQIIFLDFDGATINAAAIFGGGNPVANLSPMSSFLANWGLTPADEDAVIDAVVDKVQEQFDKLLPLNPSMNYEIRNSRDHADPWGQPDVTRVIIGGTQAQLGISTVGIAESIDPGNFDSSQTAVVLLDILSSASNSFSANQIARAPGVPILEAIKRGVGNVAAHEAGHTFGNWHTFNNNSTPCIMDSGGGAFRQNIYEAGPDNTIGTADDQPTAFVQDFFASEGIGVNSSRENTDYRTAYALSSLPCVGDFDSSGAVDGTDLGILLLNWGACPAPCAADLNGDGAVDGTDLGILLLNWGGC